MSNKLIQIRSGTTLEHSTFIGKQGEITVDLDKGTLVVHDQATLGGHPLAKHDLSNVTSSIGIEQLKITNSNPTRARDKSIIAIII